MQRELNQFSGEDFVSSQRLINPGLTWRLKWGSQTHVVFKRLYPTSRKMWFDVPKVAGLLSVNIDDVILALGILGITRRRGAGISIRRITGWR